MSTNELSGQISLLHATVFHTRHLNHVFRTKKIIIIIFVIIFLYKTFGIKTFVLNFPPIDCVVGGATVVECMFRVLPTEE